VIFWQTQKTARGANPGARVPRRKPDPDFEILIDSRERYPFRFSAQSPRTERTALPAGDYGVAENGAVVASVERKTLENFVASLSDGTLVFQMQKLAELPSGAVVVEGSYSGMFRLDHAPAPWLADVLARLQVRYPEVPIVFADTRRFAEQWTYRFLAAAAAPG
jgi:ERCC4-type nuclease